MGYPQPGQQGSPYAKAELVQMPPGQKAKVRKTEQAFTTSQVTSVDKP